jgi:hypothetical protein
LFYFVLKDRRWAYKLSIVYAVFMAMQGVGHGVATVVTERYFNGFARGYTGAGLLIVGVFMVYLLQKEMPD